jgi:hypothetical protein
MPLGVSMTAYRALASAIAFGAKRNSRPECSSAWKACIFRSRHFGIEDRLTPIRQQTMRRAA